MAILTLLEQPLADCMLESLLMPPAEITSTPSFFTSTLFAFRCVEVMRKPCTI